MYTLRYVFYLRYLKQFLLSPTSLFLRGSWYRVGDVRRLRRATQSHGILRCRYGIHE
jgi:hypothetical protein